MKGIRETKGVTQQKLAEKIGVAPRTIGRYESGERKPDKETQFQIAEMLGVTVTELFPGEGDSGKDRKKVKEKNQRRQDEQRKMCPFRTFTRREPDGYTAQRFSQCMYESCMMYKNEECTMKS